MMRFVFDVMKVLAVLVVVMWAVFAEAAAPQVGQPLPAWQEGMIDLHFINTGKGDAAFFVFPDGTTMLWDAGDMRRASAPQYDQTFMPDDSKSPGQWIVDYIRMFHPFGPDAALDYAGLTHFHGDHMGQVYDDTPTAPSGAYRLTGITEVGELMPIKVLLDRAWPDYDQVPRGNSPMMRNYRDFVRWQREHRGLEVQRFEPGRNDQIVLRHNPQAHPNFEVRNIAANGIVWTGKGTEVRDRNPPGQSGTENSDSCAFRLSYGKFRFFDGGDMVGVPRSDRPAWHDVESAVAWVVGPVDVHTLNHHGYEDAANAYYLSVLRPRIHIICAHASSHPGADVMRRLLSEQMYPGPRDVFLTNGMWEGRLPHMERLFGKEDTQWLAKAIDNAAASQGHVVVRVDPGGDRYHVIVLEDTDAKRYVKSVHGPYQSGRD